MNVVCIGAKGECSFAPLWIQQKERGAYNKKHSNSYIKCLFHSWSDQCISIEIKIHFNNLLQ